MPALDGPPKTYACRRVELPGGLADELAEHLAGRGGDFDDFVFTAPDGGPLRHTNFYARDFKPAVHRSGVHPATRFHDLRHTAAALMIAAGADIKVLQRMLGHSSAVLTLDRYGHLFPGQAESVADRLDEMAEAAGVVQRAEVVAIDRGRS